jgi:crossover junction endodeoxyribonuclease RuvC
MRILGVDPGVATIGLGLISAPSSYRLQALDWLTIETAAGLPFPQRLADIRKDFSAFLDETNPDLCVVERLFFKTNRTTAIDVAHARGVIILTLAERGIPLLEPTPMQLKMAIAGDGSADKKQMQQMIVSLLRLTETPKPDDAADALALASYGALRSVRTMDMAQ